ncbi:MAG TPA: GreA/GreB family elongation factor [Chthoniobacterales bacterium]|jgi:transcription elongation GreA/GreB family factor|nr:GreA/GreB family elongation factor [Chthoniobacterales bacterium]
MDAELEKLVESSKITSKAAEKLDTLKPGTFCLHKSWGFGRVAEWNLLLNQIVIDFTGKKGHPMQLQYAADNLEMIPAGHFLARKANDLAGTKKLAKEDPVAMVRNILESREGSATALEISEWMVPDLFTEAEWKRWWDSARKQMKASGAFSIPAKKTEPIQVRAEGVSQADELIETFNQARQPKQQLAALEEIAKSSQQFKEPEKQLQSVIAAIENVATRNQKLHPELAFEFVLVRDELLERFPQLKTTHIGLTIEKLIAEEEKRLVSILPKLPAAKEKRILQVLPAALGELWSARALLLMQSVNGRMVAQIPNVFRDSGKQAELKTMLERSVREHSATSEMLVWLIGEREDWSELVNPELLNAILSALEREQHSGPGRASKLQRLLMDERQLFHDMFSHADAGLARDAMRRLQLSPLFDELTKRSLLARIVKVFPDLESMIAGAQPQEKAQPLVVSWSSLDRRKAEYEELVKKKIPENVKEISLARSYGDLSENFEYKAAKQMQAVLARQRAELERDLQNARGTSFENADTSRVSIGTVVTVRDKNSQKTETYTILGAWDGDPDRNIISYQTAIGQALLGKTPGEVVALPNGEVEIVSIEPAPIDKPTETVTQTEPVSA